MCDPVVTQYKGQGIHTPGQVTQKCNSFACLIDQEFSEDPRALGEGMATVLCKEACTDMQTCQNTWVCL